ncbi:cysteine desulfurase [Sphingomonas sp. RP10(2022)]|uniref:Cysteine desulfurase n=1 Tax=Sphingomonas liriopis TaxID=2949094 RepID=A0A9X2KPG2_9SPHN|nr:cysteine desulfurase family protein [Sphingomonas liriopis]MCP3733842.1 cysteine desulfurase [Sphingomonas liriopis]
MADIGIYLDHQASAPPSPTVLSAMMPFISGIYANPHSDDHAAGWAASDAVEAARAHVAGALGAETGEIVFTSGATEANNIAILGVAEAATDRRAIVVGAIDHKSVLAPARALGRRGFKVHIAPVDDDGAIDLAVLGDLVNDDTLLVSIGAVNNEIGSVQRLADISRICRDAGALLHSDATQGLAWGAVDVEAAGVDFASVSAHKAGGPKGVGALFVSSTSADRIAPVIHGGDQENGLRPGTLPTPLCVGFGAACTDLPDEDGIERWREVTDHLLAGLRGAIPGLRLNGAPSPRHPGNLSVLLPDGDAAAVVARLQPRLAVSRGSACTSGTPEPSHVLRAIGLSAVEAERTIRLSTGPGTRIEEVERAVALIAAAVRAT